VRVPALFGELKPDNAPHATDGLIAAEGVYAVANGYKPVGQFSQVASALSGTFKGAASFVASDGTARFIAGNATNLYYLSSGTWTSALGALTVNDRWRYTQFGDEVICVNGGAPVAFNLVAATAASLAGSPPTADLCATVRDFVVLGRTAGANNAVSWCAIGDAHVWSAGTNQAGTQPLYSGGKVMGLSSGEHCIILQRHAVKRMSYTGVADDPWQFDEISTNFGCFTENSVVQMGRLTGFYGDRGFAICDGAEVYPIGEDQIDTTFRKLYSDQEIRAMWSAADPINHLMIWVVTGKAWIYNVVKKRWTTASGNFGAVLTSFTEAVSIDALDAIYGNLDAIPYSLDDSRFAGGEPKLTVLNSAGAFGTLTGSPMAAAFELPFIEYAGHREARIRRVRPLWDGASGMTLRADARKSLGSSENSSVYTQLNSAGDMPVRIAGRSVKLKVEIAAGTVWNFAQGVELDLAPGGRS
jgi:hypothetical protein